VPVHWLLDVGLGGKQQTSENTETSLQTSQIINQRLGDWDNPLDAFLVRLGPPTNTRGHELPQVWASVVDRYVSDYARNSLLSYAAEAANGFEHNWVGYVPLPGFAAGAMAKEAINACFNPGGE
jgi:hypothetical protein